MKEKIKAGVIGSFIGDSLALGVHWIYNTNVIDKKYGRVEIMLKPELAKFHRGKEKGAFTHYGDQMKILLDSMVEKSSFDLDNFADCWQKLFKNYNGYMDHATQETLANFSTEMHKESLGSSSSDLAGAARIAPLVACYSGKLKALIQSARNQTSMTHNHPGVISCAELFAQISYLVLQGVHPVAAIAEAGQSPSLSKEIGASIKAGLESRSMDTRQVISDFGQMCDFNAALPSTIHLIAKYEENFKEALIENIMAGGDSAARGMLVGLILGCYHGMLAIPEGWIMDMIEYVEIVKLIERLAG